jgi:lysyl-tRNA synthetase class 2
MIDPDGLRARATVLRAVRAFLDGRGYVEVPTPVLVPSGGLEEHLHAVVVPGGFLRTSPEFALKKALAAGLPRIYEVAPCFREREDSPWHGREFLMLEWYRAGATLPDLMDEVEALVAVAADALGVPAPARWERTTVREAMLRHTGVDPLHASAAELSPADADDPDTAFFRRWLQDVEPRLGPATFVADWPAGHAALARVVDTPHGPVAARFEAFLGGIELANAFQELLDAAALRARWEHVNAARAGAGEVPHPVDEGLLDAVARMPATAGIALGLDRLVAVLLGWRGIGRGRVDV